MKACQESVGGLRESLSAGRLRGPPVNHPVLKEAGQVSGLPLIAGAATSEVVRFLGNV